MDEKVAVPPSSDPIPSPHAAVFVSYPPTNPMLPFKIAGRLGELGVAVFLDEASNETDRESSILSALCFADEVLLVITPDTAPPDFKAPAFLDRRYVWLAVGVAFARGIPLHGLLMEPYEPNINREQAPAKGARWVKKDVITKKEVKDCSAIPRHIRGIPLFDTLESYFSALRGRTITRSGQPPLVRSRICFSLLDSGTLAHCGQALSALEKQLGDVGVESNRWHRGAGVDSFDAAILIAHGHESPSWDADEISFLYNFQLSEKPLVLLSFSNDPVHQEVRRRFPQILPVQYRDGDSLSFLQLVWAILGYRMHDSYLGKSRVSLFISYSHDSDEHSERVWKLSERLRKDGIECRIDQHQASPEEGWPRWCRNQVQESDFVLVACTEIYKARYEGKTPPKTGLGANWEGSVITLELYRSANKNSKFIPVLFSKEDEQHIPLELSGATYYDLSSEKGYEQLLRRLTDQPERRPSEVWPNFPSLPSR